MERPSPEVTQKAEIRNKLVATLEKQLKEQERFTAIIEHGPLQKHNSTLRRALSIEYVFLTRIWKTKI